MLMKTQQESKAVAYKYMEKKLASTSSKPLASPRASRSESATLSCCGIIWGMSFLPHFEAKNIRDAVLAFDIRPIDKFNDGYTNFQSDLCVFFSHIS